MEAVQRRKGSAKCYYLTSAVVYFVLVLDSIISLGAFGVMQKRVADFTDDLPQGSRCILFGEYYDKIGDLTIIKLSGLGVCVFTLWGQVSIAVLTFVWLVYRIILIFIGPRLVSPMRILDFVAMFLAFLLSFSLSVTLTAGLNTTCGVVPDVPCSRVRLISLHGGDEKVYFYEPLHHAQTSSWIATITLFILTTIHLIFTVIYCKKKRKERMEAQYDTFVDEGEPSSPPVEDQESPVELQPVAESKVSKAKKALLGRFTRS